MFKKFFAIAQIALFACAALHAEDTTTLPVPPKENKESSKMLASCKRCKPNLVAACGCTQKKEELIEEEEETKALACKRCPKEESSTHDDATPVESMLACKDC